MENKFLEWMTGETETKWWNDSGIQDEVEYALANGADGITMNPCIIAATLEKEPEKWKDIIQVDPELTGDARNLANSKGIVTYYTKKFADKWAKGDKRCGGVCCQVSPARLGDAPYMIQLMNQIGEFAPNVYVKVPATKAGLKAFEEGIAKGYNMVSTVSFSIAQVVAAAEAQKRGEARAKANGVKAGNGVAVLMVGRIDGYIRDVVSDSGYDVPESDVMMASIAVVKKAYKIFKERGYHTILMPAGARGLHHILELVGGDIVHSIAPSYAKMLGEENPPHVKTMDKPVDPKTLDNLLQIPEFRKAYDEDGMKPEDFISYPPVYKIATQFELLGWDHTSKIRL